MSDPKNKEKQTTEYVLASSVRGAIATAAVAVVLGCRRARRRSRLVGRSGGRGDRCGGRRVRGVDIPEFSRSSRGRRRGI